MQVLNLERAKWTLTPKLELKVGGKLGRGVKPANCWYEGNGTGREGQ